MNKILLWLDGLKNPFEHDNLGFNPKDKNVSVVWINNYDSFIEHLLASGLPKGICIGANLKSEKGTFDCARYLTRYCMNYNIPLPHYSFITDDRYTVEAVKIIFDRYDRFFQQMNPPSEDPAYLLGFGQENELPF